MLKFFFKLNLNPRQKLYFDLNVNRYYLDLYEYRSSSPLLLFLILWQYIFIFQINIIFFFSFCNFIGLGFISFLFHIFGLVSILMFSIVTYKIFIIEWNFFCDYDFIVYDENIEKKIIDFIYWHEILVIFCFFISFIIIFIAYFNFIYVKFIGYNILYEFGKYLGLF